MSCRFEQEVLLLADGEVAPERRLLVEAHLGVCAACAALEETLDRVDLLLASGEAAPLGVVATLQLPARRRAPVRAMSAAAALLLAALLLRPLPPATAPPRPPDVRGETSLRSVPTRPPPVTPATPVAEAPVPALPALPLRDLLLALSPDGETFLDDAHALAEQVRRRGARGTDLLAEALDPAALELARRALAVAERAPSPGLERALLALLDCGDLAPHAARALGSAGGAASVPALERALDGAASVEAREALVAIGGRAAIDALLRHADAPEVLDALARLSPRHAAALCVDAGLVLRRPALLPELRADARRGDLRAIVLLAEVRDPEVLPLLREQARTAARVGVAVRGLLALDGEEAFAEAYALAGRSTAAAEGFRGVAGAEPRLLARLGRGTFAERALTLDLLSMCGGEATARALSAALPEGALRPLAVRTLGATRCDLAVAPLEAILRDERHAAEAVRALARIGSARSAEVLANLLTDRRHGREAARVLSELPEEVVVPVLLDRVGRSQPARRVLAGFAGADLGGAAGPWRAWWSSRT